MENNNLVTKESLAQEMGLILPKNITDTVMNSVNSLLGKQQLYLPKNYVVGNALKSAYLKLQEAQDKNGVSVLQSCTQTSIANALLKMVVLGLNPSKDQAYFVAYGKNLTLMPSVYGKITAVKRINGVLDVRADVIYQDTEYELTVDEFGNDNISIIKPCPLDKRKGENIVGAWAKIIFDENVWGTKEYSCIMSMEDIKAAWNQGATKGNSPAHKNFTGEMAKKSVINRCIKNYINSRDDQDILIDTLKSTIADEYEKQPVEKQEETIDFEINENVAEAVFEERQEAKEIEFE